MRLDFGALLLGINNAELIQMLQLVEYWSHGNVDDNNIKSGGLTGSTALIDWSVPVKKLAWREIPIPLCKVIPAANTTTSVDGGYFYYDAARFPGGSWYLEALLKAESPATATLSLKLGAAVLSSVSTANTDWTLVRASSPVQMPSTAEALTCTLASSDNTKNAYTMGASLIFVPA